MMERFFTRDQIIDKHAFNIKIYKHARLHDPQFIQDFEKFAVGISDGNPALWWTEMTDKIMEGIVYVFRSKEDFEKFKELNSSFINKINFIL